MKKIYLTAYAFTAVLAVLLLVRFIPEYTDDSGYGLPPSLLPNLLSGVMLAASVVLFFQTLLRKDTEGSCITGTHLFRLAAFSAIMFGTFPLMSVIGFFPGGCLAMLGLQLLCGQRSPLWLLGLSIGLPGFFWAVLTYVLQIPMP